MKILLVDDDILICSAISKFLEYQMSHEVTQCNNGFEALELFKKNPFPLVLADIRMPGMTGIELLENLKMLPEAKTTDVVLITGHGDLTSAIQALRLGAYDYLQKPIEVEEMAAVIARIEEHQSLLLENFEYKHQFEGKLNEATQETLSKLETLQNAYAEVVGIGKIGIFSDTMRSIVDMAEKFHHDRTIPVLIEGETGTGKEIIARLVHHGHGEETTPFISLNCSAIAPGLFESELFGYEGGAFSGSKTNGMMGKLEHASGGTLFLDEIGDLPLELQPKLLRVIQEREIYRVGGLKNIKLDVRIICATNRTMDTIVNNGLFRRDLYYRLNTGKIYIPPLQQRREEIAPLAQMFLEQYAEQKKRRFRLIQKKAIQILENHIWPGNVRELENAIERVVLLYDSVEITAHHLQFLNLDDDSEKESNDSNGSTLSLYLPPDSYSLESGEAEIIKKALSMFKGNKTRTAAYLRISLSTLKRKINKIA